MSSAVRTTQIPYFSFHRSSTPIPYSLGSPILNWAGGSLSTFGNMKRPVAARAAADAAENAPHASPIHARRVRSGEVSSGSRPAAAATAGLVVVDAFAAAPPAEAADVVLPARSGMGAAGGRGAGAGRGAAVCAAAPAAASGAGFTGGVAAGFAAPGGAPGTTAFGSSAMLSLHIYQLSICLRASIAAWRTLKLGSFALSASIDARSAPSLMA